MLNKITLFLLAIATFGLNAQEFTKDKKYDAIVDDLYKSECKCFDKIQIPEKLTYKGFKYYKEDCMVLGMLSKIKKIKKMYGEDYVEISQDIFNDVKDKLGDNCTSYIKLKAVYENTEFNYDGVSELVTDTMSAEAAEEYAEDYAVEEVTYIHGTITKFDTTGDVLKMYVLDTATKEEHCIWLLDAELEFIVTNQEANIGLGIEFNISNTRMYDSKTKAFVERKIFNYLIGPPEDYDKE